MSYSYKPVLIKAMFDHVDENGKVRVEDMKFTKRSKDIEYVDFNKFVFKRLTDKEIKWIISHCDKKLEEYYNRPVFRNKDR